MTYEEAQELKRGDKVLVTRAMESRADGWYAHWVHGMNYYVGRLCEVSQPKGTYGIRLKPIAEDLRSFNFPWQVLERAEPNWI